jgi:hypothetical protein
MTFNKRILLSPNAADQPSVGTRRNQTTRPLVAALHTEQTTVLDARKARLNFNTMTLFPIL